MQDWKSGNHPMGNIEAYNPDMLPENGGTLQPPTLHVCQMVSCEDGSKTLAISSDFRQKWNDDATREDEWAREIKAFDARCLMSIEPRKPALTNHPDC